MKILLSAFAFSPIWGSEPGVGWSWATTLAREHDVTVLTHGYFRAHLAGREDLLKGLRLRIEYLDMPPLLGRFHEQLLNSQLYYVRWQWHALRAARTLVQAERYDLVHHVTWGNFRLPSFMGFLGLPCVLGPMGGGDRAPWRLYAGLPLKERLKEALRDMVIASSRFDPILRVTLSRCALVLCRTHQTLQALPGQAPRAIAHDVGAPQISPPPPRVRATGAPLELLFAGRLLGLKGIHLALRAMAVAKQRGLVARLTLLGEGPMEAHLKQLAATLGLADQVQFTGKVPRETVMARYHEADVFLFPSLHDSGGTVVLEALSRGLPVICVDLGGPQYFLNPECGFVVAAQSASAEEVIEALAGTLLKIAAMPAVQLQSMRQAALQQAQAMDWPAQIHHAYEQIAKQIGVRS